MFKLYVVWPTGQGYTRDFMHTSELCAHITTEVYGSGDVPTVLSVTYLDEDIATPAGKMPVGVEQVGGSAVHGAKVRD